MTDCRLCQYPLLPLKCHNYFQSKTIWNWNALWLSLLHLVFSSPMKHTTDWMMSLSPLAELIMNRKLTDNEHLTRKGPRLIMNISPISHGPVFSQCKLANSESWLYGHTCTQLWFWTQFSPHLPWRRFPGNEWIDWFEYVRKSVLLYRRHIWLPPFKRSHRDLFMSFPTLERLVILTTEHVFWTVEVTGSVL